MPFEVGAGRMIGYDIFVRGGGMVSARCSIDNGGFDRGRFGIKELSVSSTPEAQSAIRHCDQLFLYRRQFDP